MSHRQESLPPSGSKRVALAGLLVVLAFGTTDLQLAADDGVVRFGQPTGKVAICHSGECDAGESEYGWQLGFQKAPANFDRWFYLKRALGYEIVYPVRPWYSDPRDGRVFSAQGFGIPVASPLSAVVEYQYNYSQGPQGSRLTPVSRPRH